MPEKEFVKSMIEVAAKVKGGSITEAEKSEIIKAFNSKKGSAYERAKESIEEVVGKRLPDESMVIEKAASLNNLQNLLAQMNSAADNWQKTKK